MGFDEQIARIEQVVREREALELFYADLLREATERAEAASATGVRETVPQSAADLIVKLANALQTEREQASMLAALLLEAYAELVKAHDEPA